MNDVVNQVSVSPTASPDTSKAPLPDVWKINPGSALLERKASKLTSAIKADKKIVGQSPRTLESGSALFVASKQKAALSPDKKLPSNVQAAVPNFIPSNVKFIAFPKMRKVTVFHQQKDAQLAARVKLDMNSALKDRSNAEQCFSAPSYEPNDQSAEGMSTVGGNRANLFGGGDLLAATAAGDVFRRRQADSLSDRATNICIIVSITLLLLVVLSSIMVTIYLLFSTSASAADDEDSTMPSAIENRTKLTRATKDPDAFGSF